MRLGNSNGNNRGKKYIIRSKHDRQACKQGVAKAADFNKWFGQNYQSLLNEQIAKGVLYDDVMNETYVRMYEGILYGNMNVEDYRSYFSRAYFTNSIQNSIQKARFFTLNEGYDNRPDESYDYELEKRQKRLEIDVFDYVYSRYKLREFELFKMYMSLKPAVNYRILADITHYKVHQIQSIVSKIKKDVCSNSRFAERRRELVA